MSEEPEQLDSDETVSQTTWDEVEKEARLIKCLLERIPHPKCRVEAAEYLVFETAFWGGCCYDCSQSILKRVKHNLKEFKRECQEAEAEEEDE